jgi:hypothetical protein
MPRLISFKSGQQSRSILAVHDVYDEHDIRFAQVSFNFAPLVIIQGRAEVVSRDAQLYFVFQTNIPLRLPERREQA